MSAWYPVCGHVIVTLPPNSIHGTVNIDLKYGENFMINNQKIKKMTEITLNKQNWAFISQIACSRWGKTSKYFINLYKQKTLTAHNHLEKLKYILRYSHAMLRYPGQYYAHQSINLKTLTLSTHMLWNWFAYCNVQHKRQILNKKRNK